jgi:hypothetical protein
LAKSEKLCWKAILAGKANQTMEEFEQKISKIDSSFLHKRLDYIFLLR